MKASYPLAIVLLFLTLSIPPGNVALSFAEDEPLGLTPAIQSEAAEDTPEELQERIERDFYGKETDGALLRLARIYSRKKDLKSASRAYQRIIEGYPEGRAVAEALLELAYLRYKGGEIDGAKQLLDALSSRKDATDEARERVKALSGDIGRILSYGSQEQSSPIAVGAVLPLKGAFAHFGEDALKGILLAAEVFGPSGAPVEVYVKDVEGDSASAASAVEELSENGRVVGIVGPLLSSVARESALYAQKLGIPLVTLSQKEGVTSAGGYIFRNSLTPADQALTIASYAHKSLGVRKFAILYPQNAYGSELAQLFREEVKRQGAQVVMELGYVPGTRDFSRELKTLFGITGKERKEGRRTIKEFKASADIDALYIPEYYETISMIVPYIEYYDIKGVRLLGSNGWNSQRLIELSGNGVEGAVFVDGFFAGSRRQGSSEFSERFRKTYGKAPGAIEAQAYDAARILIAASLGKDGSASGREAVRDRMRALKDFTGSAGALSFNERGEAVKRLFVLTVKDGAITEAPED